DFDGQGYRLRDLHSRFGTFLNGTRVNEAVLHDGDKIAAGKTLFVVHIGGPAVPSPAPEQRVLEILRGQPQPLYALLDAGRDPKVLAALRSSHETYQSLYEGAKGQELAGCGPWLVRLPPQSALLNELVREGWGNSWGVYLICDQPFAKV